MGNEELVVYYIKDNERKRMDQARIEDQIDKLVNLLKYLLSKLKDISEDFQIEEFTARAGVELNAWILKADGGIEIKWERREGN
jgi:hypothetical protein